MTNLYQQYYTAADVTIYIVNRDHRSSNRTVQLDTAVGIGFRHSISAMPVYGLGDRNPSFFSAGNSIVSGTLELSFKSSQYLARVLNYVLGTDDIIRQRDNLAAKLQSKAKLTDDEFKQYNAIMSGYIRTKTQDSSLSYFNELVDIVIMYNNSNSLKDGLQSSTIIQGVRFLEFVQSVSSSAEAVVTDQIRFTAKNVNNQMRSESSLIKTPSPTSTFTEQARQADAAAQPAT
jgi:hypothetical protein